MRLLLNMNLRQKLHGRLFSAIKGLLADQERSYHAVFEDRHMRKEIEALKDHPDVSSDLVSKLRIVSKLSTQYVDRTGIVLGKLIDAPYERGLS